MKFQIQKTAWNIIYSILIVFCLANCKKLVNVDPPATSVTGSSVYTSDATAIAVLNGLYTKLSGLNTSGSFLTGTSGVSFLSGLSADEFTLWNGNVSVSINSHYRNDLSALKGGFEFWSPIYNYLFACNSAIEALNNSTVLSPAIKTHLEGEAKFLRAFFYFYLVNFYGDVPLALSSDYQLNAKLGRTPKSEVYKQIISDLKDAQNLLSSEYLDAQLTKISAERVRPNKWVATSLLARVYLYNEEWDKAETEATAVIDNTGLFSLSTLNNSFLKASLNNKESIWQLQPVTTSPTHTLDGRLFIIPSTGPSLSFPVYLSDTLLNSFEANDNRKSNWISSIVVDGVKYFYPYKYKVTGNNTPVTEFLMVIRLGELFLIRAEARAHQNNISGAKSDLNSIRTRAGLTNTTADDKSTLLNAVIHERKVELFTELGHRWFDLKRTGKIDAVMNIIAPKKSNGALWRSYQSLYPIPITDIERNPVLVQNTGY